ncbi:MAG TPA: hypothetical protein VMT80_00640, partial [Candidatus Paceibacterota bacterium]|nr:hypothetical protein [Candidatus Paceibacterota bacterium]
MKTSLGCLAVAVLLALAPLSVHQAHAQSSTINGNHQQTFSGDFVPLAPIPGLTDQNSTRETVLSGDFATFFNQLYQYLIGLSVALAIIWIIWGGILISTSDSIGNHARGRKKIEDAILGLALVLAPALVFSIINNSILNLSVNFEPIDLSTPSQQQQTTPPPSQSYGNFSSPGSTINCPPSGSQGNCADALTDSCQKAGGDPVEQTGTLGDVSIYCRPKNQTTVPPGSTTTAAD